MRNFAIIDRDGFFSDTTRVYSTHNTRAAAIQAAKSYRVSISGNQPKQSSAMVISAQREFVKGEIVYSDTIRRQYNVEW